MFRSQLSPFLKLIMKALGYELENYEPMKDLEELESICDEIIREARFMSTTSSSISPQNPSNQNTLQMEQNQLKFNLK